MRHKLNERQLAVLRWVGKGCPDGIWDSNTHKTSCQALQNRGLVKVSRRGGQWNAVLTDTGRHYLAHGTYPDQNAPARKLPMPRLPRVPAPTSSGPATTSPPCGPSQPRKTFTHQLLEELEAAGGRIVKSGPDTDAWYRRASLASRSERIPKTKELHWYRCREGVEIKLVDIPAWRLAVLEQVVVSARLTRPHPVVQAIQKVRHPLGLTKPVQQRTLRLLHALLTTVEADGHTCRPGVVDAAPLPYRRLSARPHFTITAQGQTVEFRVLQEKDRSEHIPTDKERAEAKKYSWARIPRFDYTPSERLRLVLSGGQPHRASEWADSSGRSLEDQLAEIVQEIGLRGQAAERKRQADLEAARQQRLRWEAAMAEARDRYAEAYRVKQLESQHADWRHATRLGDYLEAARAHVASLPPGSTRTQAEEWVEWAMRHVARGNPLARGLRLPDIPEQRAEDLKPFLGGLSPYGPRY
ncbi:hypothetical protein [Streptomyces sp. NPDC051219]|uniref:hypothetical protein n=1 Tax=Streptomyces sp. NPDC051219 TaxID=3155283 RepID=UPI00344457D9